MAGWGLRFWRGQKARRGGKGKDALWRRWSEEADQSDQLTGFFLSRRFFAPSAWNLDATRLATDLLVEKTMQFGSMHGRASSVECVRSPLSGRVLMWLCAVDPLQQARSGREGCVQAPRRVLPLSLPGNHLDGVALRKSAS